MSSLPAILKIALDISWYVGLVGFAIGLAGLVLIGVVIVLGDSGGWPTLPVSVPVSAIPAERTPTPIDGGWIQDIQVMRYTNMMVTFTAGLPVFVCSFLILLFTLIACLYIIHQLREFLKQVKAGRPFIVENAGRFRKVGWAVIIAALLTGAFKMIIGAFLVRHMAIEGMRLTQAHGGFVSYFFLGLGIILLAQVFDHGIRLQEEQELTI